MNLAQRLEDAARPAGSTVASAATVSACAGALPGLPMVELPALVVKGRAAPVPAYLLEPEGSALDGRTAAAARHRDAG